MPVAINFSELSNFTTKQLQAHETLKHKKFLFFGGSKSGGKSYFIRWEAAGRCLYYSKKYKIKNPRVMIACETYRALADRQLVKIHEEFPTFLGQWKEAAAEYHLRDDLGIICFRNLDDPTKYNSVEYAAIFVDELTLNPRKELFDTLRSLLRCPPIPANECVFVGTGNPIGVGLGWVKQIWIDKHIDVNDDPSLYAFVQALPTDNPYNPPGYIDDLNRLPEALRRAYVEGSWTSFEGQYFPEWNESIHVVPAFRIPKGQGVWYRSMDWGFTQPSSVGWWWLSPEGFLYRTKELYRAGLTPSELKKVIMAMTMEHERPVAMPSDPSIWKTNEQSKISVASILGGDGGVPCLPANNERVGGWMRMHEWLRPYEVITTDGHVITTARLKVFSNCTDFIRTVPAAVHDKVKVEDLDTRGDDHPLDDCRYLLNYLPLPEFSAITERAIVDEEAGYLVPEWSKDNDDDDEERVRDKTYGW